MEDYDVYNEIQDINSKRTILFVEENEEFVVNNLLNSEYQLIPIRFSYDLSCFSNSYIDKTKELFIYYYNKENSFSNEQIRLKKHFIHYRRVPFIAYIPLNKDFSKKLVTLLESLGIECITNKELFIRKITNKNKLILLDCDGTLKNSKGEITKRAREAINKNIKLGNKIIIATSRPRYLLLKTIKESGTSNIVVSSNGAEIYDFDSDTILYSQFINVNDIKKFIEIAFKENVRLIISIDDYDFVTKNPRNSKQILLDSKSFLEEIKFLNVKQCMFIDKNANGINKIKNLIKKNKNVIIADEISKDDTYEEKWFSVVNSNVSKGNALMFLTNYYGIPISNTVAIGNGKNDVSMFKLSNFSVAVGNAPECIKSLVDYVTLDNDSDGVAIVLEDIINKQ